MPEAGEAAVRYVVRGRVQGVGFRWYVMRQAERLGVRGWVSNRPDGSVEVVAVGSPEHQARLAELLARGPTGARVEAVEKSELPHQMNVSNSFDLR